MGNMVCIRDIVAACIAAGPMCWEGVIFRHATFPLALNGAMMRALDLLPFVFVSGIVTLPNP